MSTTEPDLSKEKAIQPKIYSNHRYLLLLVTFRIINSLFVQSYFNPDEYWQSLEIAHKVVFNYGYKTWEWDEGIRSYVHPLLFILLYKLLYVMGLDFPVLIIWAPKVIQAIFAGIGDYYTYKLANRFFGKEIAKLALVCQCFNWFNMYCLVRTFSNSMETVLTSVAMFYWPWPYAPELSFGRPRALFFAGIACIIRPTSALIWLPLGVWHLLSLSNWKLRFSLVMQELLPIGTCCLLFMTCVDYLYYGRFVFVPYNFILFNVVKDIGSFYGTHPWHWYITQGFPAIAGPYLPFALLGFILSKRYAPVLLIGWCIFVFSLLAHKEFRFLLPILPLSMCYAGYGTHSLIRKRSKSLTILVYFVVSVNIPIAIYLGLFHQIGRVNILSYVTNNFKSGESIQFLMPCHSTPFYSHTHRNDITLLLWECPPNFSDPNSLDQAEQFKTNPLQFVTDYYANHELPTYFAAFDSMVRLVNPFLENKNYTHLVSIFEKYNLQGISLKPEYIQIFELKNKLRS